MKIDAFSPGTPCWADLTSSDPDGAAAFYSELFGWTVVAGGPEVGGYQMCTLDGDPVAGIVGMASESVPSAWMPYLAVSTATDTIVHVEAAGGHVVAGPDQVADLGWMCVVTDATGAAIGLWQKDSFSGFSRVGEPSAYIWSELLTSSVATSVGFYESVFGLRPLSDVIGDIEACQMAIDEMPIVGVLAKAEDDSASSDRWEIYFVVASLEATCSQAIELGGTVVDGPIGLPVGRIAHLVDPTGAGFGILQPQHG